MNFIRGHAHTMSPADIGAKLDRSEDVVVKYIKDHVPPSRVLTRPTSTRPSGSRCARSSGSEAWKNLKEEMFDEELKFFEEGYLKMMAQMGRRRARDRGDPGLPRGEVRGPHEPEPEGAEERAQGHRPGWRTCRPTSWPSSTATCRP
jgi:hypothetical protein